MGIFVWLLLFLEATFSDILFNEHICILSQMSMDIVSKGPLVNKSVLLQVAVWRRSVSKSEPIMTVFIEAYMRYRA